MKKIAVIFTSFGPLVNNFKKILNDTLEDCELICIADDSLIRDVMRTGAPDENVEKRTFLHIESAIAAGAQLVVIACSSVGQVAQAADAKYSVPVIRIDDAMAMRAVAAGGKVGVIASLETTIEPTVKLLRQKAEAAGKDVEIISRVAQGAYQALGSGDPETHDRLVTEAAVQLAKETDVILLAQGSMARLDEPLNKVIPVPVLTSPKSCALAVREMLKSL